MTMRQVISVTTIGFFAAIRQDVAEIWPSQTGTTRQLAGYFRPEAVGLAMWALSLTLPLVIFSEWFRATDSGLWYVDHFDKGSHK